jgi:hypothetical protein
MRLLTKQLEKRSRGEGRCERIWVRISSGRVLRVGGAWSWAEWSGAGTLMLGLWIYLRREGWPERRKNVVAGCKTL